MSCRNCLNCHFQLPSGPNCLAVPSLHCCLVLEGTVWCELGLNYWLISFSIIDENDLLSAECEIWSYDIVKETLTQ